MSVVQIVKNQNGEVKEAAGEETLFADTAIEGVKTEKRVSFGVVEVEEISYADYGDLESGLSSSSLESDESEDEIFVQVAPPPQTYEAKVQLPPGFFELIGQLPNFEEIRLSESLDHKIVKKKLEEFSYEEADYEEEEQACESHDEEGIGVTSSSEYSEFDFDFDAIDEMESYVEQQRVPGKDVIEFVETTKKKAPPVGFKKQRAHDLKENALAEEMKELENDAYEFVCDLIKKVCIISDQQNAQKVLNEQFEKVKLFRRLAKLFEERNVETKINMFLDKKCVYYYRRQKIFHPITSQVNVTQLNFGFEKYKRASDELDSLMGRELCTKEIIKKQVEQAKETAAVAESDLNYETSNLERIMKNTFSGKGSSALNSSVDRRIKEMSNLRKEISKVRSNLIKIQHINSQLLGKREHLENITDALHPSNYKQIMDENYSLMRKLKEKIERLEKVRRHYFTNTHATAHMREQQSVMFETLLAELTKLEAAEFKKQNLRAHIFQLKTKHISLRKQISDVSLKSGLVDKPALLIDYDESFERLQEMKAKVANLRAEKDKIEKHISHIERHQNSCTSES